MSPGFARCKGVNYIFTLFRKDTNLHKTFFKVKQKKAPLLESMRKISVLNVFTTSEAQKRKEL